MRPSRIKKCGSLLQWCQILGVNVTLSKSVSPFQPQPVPGPSRFVVTGIIIRHRIVSKPGIGSSGHLGQRKSRYFSTLACVSFSLGSTHSGFSSAIFIVDMSGTAPESVYVSLTRFTLRIRFDIPANNLHQLVLSFETTRVFGSRPFLYNACTL